MICVIQRVSQASVSVSDRLISQIKSGMVVLLAVHQADTEREATWMAGKLANLRIFAAEERNFDLDVKQAGGSILLVSNFTVAADVARGRRPSLSAAAEPARAQALFEFLVRELRGTDVAVATGEFGADMKVSLINDGPVTFVLNSESDAPR